MIPSLVPARCPVDLNTALAQAKDALAMHAASRQADTLEAFLRARADLIAALRADDRKQPPEADLLLWEELIAELWSSGLFDDAACSVAVTKADLRSWTALLAALVSGPIYTWTEVPALAQVPLALWGLFARSAFRRPSLWGSTAQRDAHFRLLRQCIHDLDTSAAANRGSPAVRAAVTAFTDLADLSSLAALGAGALDTLSARNRLLGIARGVGRQPALPGFSREGRRLRVGFVARDFGLGADLRHLLPYVEGLDAATFDVVLYPLREVYSPIEDQLRRLPLSFEPLPGLLADQTSALSLANLDVLVFCAGPARVDHDVVALALHRLAPVQWLLSSSGTSLGQSEIDWLTVFQDGSAELGRRAFAETPAVVSALPGFVSGSSDETPAQSWTREALGLLADDFVLFATVRFASLAPEVMDTWLQLLHRVPSAKLLLQPLEDLDSVTDEHVQRLGQHLDRLAEQHGVDSSRLLLLPPVVATSPDRLGALGLIDLSLDLSPVVSVLDAIDSLRAGVPVVTVAEGRPSSWATGRLLTFLGAQALVASSLPQVVDLVAGLAGDVTLRNQVREHVAEKLGSASPVFETVLAGDVFGDLLVAAFDQKLSQGGKRSRRENAVLCLPSTNWAAQEAGLADAFQSGRADDALRAARHVLAQTPHEGRAWHAAGKAAFALGRSQRAMAYLLEAVQLRDADTTLWCDLAQVLLACDLPKQALEAVQACLGLDGRHLDALLLLGRIAEMTGQLEQIEEVAKVAAEVAPENPHVLVLVEKVRAAVARAQPASVA